MIVPFPHMYVLESPPQNGSVFQCPIFCKRNYNQKCTDFYKSIIDKEGWYKCPYGFATNVVSTDDLLIITALNIEKRSSRLELKKRINKKEFYPRIKWEEYNYIKSNFENFEPPESSGSYSLTKDYINDIFHELRKLNAQIKEQATSLLSTLSKKSDSKLQERAQNVFSTSQLVSIRLNTFDFNLNPELPFSGKKKKFQVYNKFYKVVQCLSLQTKIKQINLKFQGKSHASIRAYAVFELIPFLLIENAIKYSLENSEVSITFKEYSGTLEIEIRNYGPPINREELSKLTDRGYRGNNAKSFSSEGTGIGLYLVTAITQAHDISFNIFSNSQSTIDQGVEVSEFIVTLKFNKIL